MKSKCIFAVKRRNLFRLFLSLQMIVWILLYSAGLSAQESSVKAVSLFDGKTLTGWKTVDPAHQQL